MLTISDLLLTGLFDKEDRELVVEVNGQKLLLRCEASNRSIQVMFLVGGERKEIVQTIAWVSRRGGTVPRFSVPPSKTLYRSVDFHGGQTRYGVSGAATEQSKAREASDQLSARRLSRLLGRDGRGPARGRNRTELIQTLKADAAFAAQSSEFQALLRRDAARVLRIRNPARRADLAFGPLSTRKGISRNGALGDSPALQIFHSETAVRSTSMAGYNWPSGFTQPSARAYIVPSSGPAQNKFRQWLDGVRPTPLPVRRPAAAFREDYPLLDIGYLIGAGQSADLQTFACRWQVKGQEIRVSGLFCATGPDSDRLYIQRDTANGPAFRQVIRLIANRAGHKMMICPITGNPASFLFLRNECFASAAAHRLIHRSQRKTR